METNPNIRKEVSISAITVNKVYKSDFQKEGTLTAELKQTVETTSFYPTKSIANSLNGNIFEISDFGFEEQSFPSKETRIAWIDVPADSTKESVQAKLDQVPGAVLYRMLSNRPIIADTEQYAINNTDLPNVTLDMFADRQAVRISKDAEVDPGKLVLNNGKIQYRRTAFSRVPREDDDSRTKDPSDFYVSSALKAELNGVSHVVTGQEL